MSTGIRPCEPGTAMTVKGIAAGGKLPGRGRIVAFRLFLLAATPRFSVEED
jgi:hypothetical protein